MKFYKDGFVKVNPIHVIRKDRSSSCENNKGGTAPQCLHPFNKLSIEKMSYLNKDFTFELKEKKKIKKTFCGRGSKQFLCAEETHQWTRKHPFPLRRGNTSMDKSKKGSVRGGTSKKEVNQHTLYARKRRGSQHTMYARKEEKGKSAYNVC